MTNDTDTPTKPVSITIPDINQVWTDANGNAIDAATKFLEEIQTTMIPLCDASRMNDKYVMVERDALICLGEDAAEIASNLKGN